MTRPPITVRVDSDGIGRLQLPDQCPPDDTDREALTAAVSSVVADAFAADPGPRRIESVIAENDHPARWAMVRSGFRLEGRRRGARRSGVDDQPVDELIFGRLSSDIVGGPDGFSAVANSTMPRKRLIAHVLMRDENGRILLCETKFKTDWELPGGIVEPNESPRLGAIREIGEELGIEREVGNLLAVDWMPPYLGWDDACELIFDGGTVTEAEIADYRLDPHEIAAVRLIDLADAEPHLTPLSFRRLTAISTLDVPRTLVMEDGRPL
ncbi:NUDIX domain-containing protein [Microlunatus soli]|uniref:ADP-ribose pyrophosphatase YjhB, NUDIX family n=1 Tax=Microlunatus soli TaxID=630515 RepID=A0A1H1ZYC9_9ACTN|nr:NUDIX hydrolase [Microlunatus soli]SDT38765.1 ADP-ribose pyrophosphatase YjhB, NUDIX family [Microlunatus soli]